MALLEVRDLRTYFFFDSGRTVAAVDGVDLTVRRGSVLGLVGESGSGKSVTALSILRLLDPRARIVSGEILFRGRDLISLSEGEMREIRGRYISMVLQDPMTALNPLLTIGRQIRHAISAHQKLKSQDVRTEAIRLLDTVRLPDPERLLGAYPHQLSGGMRQRVVLAMALASGADLIIADEPTTALDVTIQLQILSLLKELREARELSMLFITHDLGLIAHICDYVCVMYCGVVVEHGPMAKILERPLHPYTQALLYAVPNPQRRGTPLRTIGAQGPDASLITSGCRFLGRCDRGRKICKEESPRLIEGEACHKVACYFPGGEYGENIPSTD